VVINDAEMAKRFRQLVHDAAGRDALLNDGRPVAGSEYFGFARHTCPRSSLVRQARTWQPFVAVIRSDNIFIPTRVLTVVLRRLRRLRLDQTILADVSIVDPTVMGAPLTVLALLCWRGRLRTGWRGLIRQLKAAAPSQGRLVC